MKKLTRTKNRCDDNFSETIGRSKAGREDGSGQMIKKTRIKIVVVTMLILLFVFVAIGAVIFSIMVTRPSRYPSGPPGGSVPYDPNIQDAVKDVESRMLREWLGWYSALSAAALSVLFAITYFLSGWIVRPVKTAMNKQKQFVSDASHELKTPISIISASTDAFTGDNAELIDNRWLQNIKSQTERMRMLTNDLLALTKLDEDNPVITGRINLSQTVFEAVLPFESVVFEAGKLLETDIADGLVCMVDKEDVVRAVNILMDNAVKYSGTGGIIKVRLFKSGAKIGLEVFNSGSGISEEDKTRIFDRFFRSDYSRARQSGGVGLGLSILKNLADNRGWRIVVNSDGKSFASFVVYF